MNAAFAIEAMKRNVVRCVSFAIGGFDTHDNNYRTHAQLQQETFDLVAALVRSLDATPHPHEARRKALATTRTSSWSATSAGRRRSTSRMGRDHYPNNSALVVSPRFRANFVFGKTDADQLLPRAAKKFVDGERAIAPPDLLATFLSAFGIEPRKYMRDGEVVRELLRS